MIDRAIADQIKWEEDVARLKDKIASSEKFVRTMEAARAAMEGRDPRSGRRRAPKGAAAELVARAVAASGDGSVSTDDVLAQAQTEDERQVSPATVRSTLQRSGQFARHNGRWYYQG